MNAAAESPAHLPPALQTVDAAAHGIHWNRNDCHLFPAHAEPFEQGQPSMNFYCRHGSRHGTTWSGVERAFDPAGREWTRCFAATVDDFGALVEVRTL